MSAFDSINIKLFARGAAKLEAAATIAVFHRWIQSDFCPETVIDVANYSHVPHGPGVILVGHQANYSIDCGGGRLGLLYNCKTSASLSDAYQAVARAAAQFESEPEFAGRIEFDRAAVELTFNDRLLVPNTAETFAALRETIEAFFAQVAPGPFDIQRATDPRERFRVERIPR